MNLLYEALEPYVAEAAAAEPAAEVLRLAIVGRPNVGKSTLINALLGEERLVTSPEPGTTRDAIAVRWQHGDRLVELVDTAGLRRRARVTAQLEELSAEDTRRAIAFAHVVALVLDATAGLERQDLSIAQQVIEEGRALVIVANKWDVVADRSESLQQIRDRLQISLPQMRGAPVVTLSALTGERLDSLLPAVLSADAAWNRRIATGPLNDWLAAMLEHHAPPLDPRGRPIRLRYMTQTGARPPSFAVFCNRPKDLPPAYVRYLENGLREAFGFVGTPIRIRLRGGRNPYAPR
jgi:GTP-binding protein